MARATAEQRYTELALRLVDRVHHTLGKHRIDDRRTGWMSGLGEKEGESHPTRSGLRIGKKLPERSVGEPFDEQLEWDRDGQYFHYLTKWMQALDHVSRSTKQPRFNLWARELAAAAYKAFSYHAPARPFDGAAGFASMLQGGTWASADPLGIGGLLMDASHLEQHADLLGRVLAAALEGLRSYAPQDDLRAYLRRDALLSENWGSRLDCTRLRTSRNSREVRKCAPCSRPSSLSSRWVRRSSHSGSIQPIEKPALGPSIATSTR